jgi:hypothetical protein
MKRFKDRIHALEARLASEREMFAQALEDYAANARARVRDRAVSPASLFLVAGAGFVVGQMLKRNPPAKAADANSRRRWGGLLAGALMSAARVASSHPGALVQFMQRIRAHRATRASGRFTGSYRSEEELV